VNNEIVIGRKYTSIIGSEDNMDQVERNSEYNENKIVDFKPIYRKRTIRTSDFFNSLKTNITSQNEILPIGCKYFQTFENGRKVIVIEEPPRIRTIRADIGMEATIEKLKITGKLKEYGYENYLNEAKSNPYSFQLSFPYVVFIIVLSQNNALMQMQPYFRLHPITSLSDYLFLAPLYNIPDSQTICLGSVQNCETVIETIENIIEKFWINRYNQDYTDNIKAYENSEAYEVHDYLSWMYFTKVNPMFIYNVKWLKHHKNIYNIIKVMKENSILSRSSNTSYDLLQKIVTGTTSEELNPHPHIKNISYSLAIKGGVITVGDEIIFEDEKFYLYSLTTRDHGETFNNVELENEKGELISVPYDEFKRGLGNLFIKNELKEANVNGQIIKPNDIITYNMGSYPIHKRIKSIRTAPDGKIEALIGNDHYLIENIDFKIMNLKNIRINGEPLDEEKEYYLVASNDNYNNSYKIKKMKFRHISISSSGNIMIRFISINDRDNNINLNYSRYKEGTSEYDLMSPTDLILPDVLCHFDKLLFNSNDESLTPKFKIVKDKGIFIHNDSAVRHYCPSSSESAKSILEKILIENGTRLYIPRISCDVDFRVGDPIVYANWSQPEDMFLISTIDKFEYIEDDKQLYIHSTSLNKKVQFKIPYVDLQNYYANIGIVRKVESQCGEWKSGDKIKANSPGISNFPKKDTNTIIAFINDGATKYPLALCTNCCTLWMNEDTMMKFNVFPFKSNQWNKLENTPIDLNKIKWQHGDHFKAQSASIKFIQRRRGTQYAFDYHYTTNWGNLEWGTSIAKNTLNDYQRHGFLMPRITSSNARSATNQKGFPNMLGGYLIDSNSRVHLRSEQFKEDF